MGTKKTVAQNLSRLMAKNPALSTLKKVDDRSGVGAETVRRTKTGDGNITLEKLEALARSFGVSVAYMVTDHDEALKSQNAELGENYAVNQQLTGYDNKVAGSIKPKSKRDQLSERINQVLEHINEDGLLVAIGRIETLAEDYPRVAKQTLSS